MCCHHSIGVLKLNREITLREINQMNVEKMKPVLLYLNSIPLFCWIFDVVTTYYAVDVLGVAGEENPLGWPLGVLGALIFYIPAFIFTYLLLFRIKSRLSLLVAILITVLTLGLGMMNLLAGLHNIGVAQIYTWRRMLVIDLTEFFNTIFVQIFFWSIVFVLIVLVIKDIVARTAQKA